MSEAKQSQAQVLFEEKDEAKATRSQSWIFFEEKDETFLHKKNSKKTQNLSRIGRFTRREAIQLKS